MSAIGSRPGSFNPSVGRSLMNRSLARRAVQFVDAGPLNDADAAADARRTGNPVNAAPVRMTAFVADGPELENDADVFPPSMFVREETQVLEDEQARFEDDKRKKLLRRSVLATAQLGGGASEDRAKRDECERALLSQFMDSVRFGYALQPELEARYRTHVDRQSRRHRKRPLEFECDADVTDEQHGEDLDDQERDHMLQERQAALRMSYEASLSATRAAQWDLDRAFFLAGDESSDDSDQGTEDMDSEWREQTNGIFRVCRRVECTLCVPVRRSDDDACSMPAEWRARKLEQENAATALVDMIKSLRDFSCAVCFSALSAEATVTEKRIDDTGNECPASFTRIGTRTRNSAVDALPPRHITPTERAMLWDCLRRVYQFSEPLHPKRWLSAATQLSAALSFAERHSVSTVSHIFFAAVQCLGRCLSPRAHEKCKRWANRSLFLIQRRCLALQSHGVVQPTYATVNVSAAGTSRAVAVENRSLASVLELVADLHDEGAKDARKHSRQKAKQDRAARAATRLDDDERAMLGTRASSAIRSSRDGPSNDGVSDHDSDDSDIWDEDDDKDSDEDADALSAAGASPSAAASYRDLDEEGRQRMLRQRNYEDQRRDPRQLKREQKARKRAAFFAELKRAAMEERVNAEMRAEIMEFRAQHVDIVDRSSAPA